MSRSRHLLATGLIGLSLLTGSTAGFAQTPGDQQMVAQNTPKKPGAKDKAKAAVGMGSDREFVNDATTGGLTEVRLGKMAENRATNPKVKEFAAMMVKQHSAANAALSSLAKEQKVAQPKPSGTDIEPDNSLSKLKGKDFDKAYVDQMVKDHDATVKLFETEASKGENKALKAWAAKTLPTLKHHQKMAKDLQTALNK